MKRSAAFNHFHVPVLALLLTMFISLSPSLGWALGSTPVNEVDATGKHPYQHRMGFNPGPANCPNNFYCVVTFPAVPGGKRLVVTNVSAQYSLTAGGSQASVSIGVDGDLFGDLLDLIATPIGGNRFLTSSSITYFVEPGRSPSVFLSGTNVTPLNNSAFVTITGYLVSVP